MTSARQSAPSVARNREVILAVLKDHLPETGFALEIASGSGEHCVAFARAFPGIDWQPSDAAPEALESIAAWAEEAGLPNIRGPIRLDMTEPDWTASLEGAPDAILAINLIHISPWAAAEGLFAGAGRLLGEGGVLYLYGAYRQGGEHTAPSNAEFEEWLKRRNPDFGVRDMAEVEALGEANGLSLDAVVPMPANNFSLIFRKRARG